jgi:hypothetical protein
MKDKTVFTNASRYQVVFIAFFYFLLYSGFCEAQSPWVQLAERPSTLQLDKGFLSLTTPSFRLQLVASSQTVAALSPANDTSFDFTPGDSLKVRSSNGMYHLGDLTLRLRKTSAEKWEHYSTAADRKMVTPLPVSGAALAAADLTNTLPGNMPLLVKRFWEKDGEQLVLRFQLTNKTTETIEIGALGIPLIFNNILSGKTLEQAHAKNVFFDPYPGADAGYLQVVRLSGKPHSLLVLPDKQTPFEAYNPLLDDPTPRGITFEGFYEWMVASKAYATQEWKDAEPWNSPTSLLLMPGETKTYGVRFVLTGSPKDIEKTLVKYRRPVVIGVPGYVLPQDVNAQLFVKAGSKIRSMTVSPDGAIDIQPGPAVKNGWKRYNLRGKTWGRARLTISYEDGSLQTVHYKIIKPEKEVVADYGRFLTTHQWFEKANDPFGRSPGVISYDNEKKEQVTQDQRAWIAGMSDEGGAGGWLGAIMKQYVLPDKTEINKLQRFIDETLWGKIQYNAGPQKYGVRKSLFCYEPDSMPSGTYSSEINFKTWSAWPLKEARSTGRSYNYPHVAAAHWVLYRLARNHNGLVTAHEWRWYLENAFHTAIAMVRLAPFYAKFGQMEGTVFFLILKDLKAEGLTEIASELENVMKKRALLWHSLAYPFGSEMPWDSTGQEEVYIWSLFFGFREKAAVTLDAILAYMPTVPHWAYNGNARRYWDFLYAGKLSRIERMIHHYGSPLNAIPVLTAHRLTPNDFYLLRVGYGGRLGALSNITEEGFAPAAFHAFPATLKNDGLSGDYGSGFFGYAVNGETVLTNHPEFGWLSFGGNLTVKGKWVEVTPTTAGRSALFMAPSGVWISLKAGKLKKVFFNAATKEVKLELDAGDAFTPAAVFNLQYPAASGKKGKYGLNSLQQNKQGDYVVPLANTSTTVILNYQ